MSVSQILVMGFEEFETRYYVMVGVKLFSLLVTFAISVIPSNSSLLLFVQCLSDGSVVRGWRIFVLEELK